MNGLTGMEKFSHLEDKIYLTIEFVKNLAKKKRALSASLTTCGPNSHRHRTGISSLRRNLR